MATAGVQLRSHPTLRNIDPDRRHTMVVGMTASKYRHISVTSGGKEGTFINLRQVNTRLRPESNGFCISNRWAAVPLSVSGGVVAIFDMQKPTKIADGVIPGLENGANVADLAWNPFDPNMLAVACDNGVVNFWDVPPEGVYGSRTAPSKSFKAHGDKINVVKFNPVAANVLATAANDGEIIVWDTGSLEPKIHFQIPATPTLAMTWSNDGKYLAVVSRDCNLRIFEPRFGGAPLMESSVLETPKGARVLYVCNDNLILISSLTKSSQRKISLYSAKTLGQIHSLSLGSSSSLLIPHYDFDSSVVFLTGKGDRTIQMFEVFEKAPYFLELAPFAAPTSHQAISFAAKNVVDVRKVEVARGARLLLSELENMTFKVPRVKMDLFQDDLFPPALITWEPVLDAEQWFQDADVSLRFQDLKPADMEPLYGSGLDARRSGKMNVDADGKNGVHGEADSCTPAVVNVKMRDVSNGGLQPHFPTSNGSGSEMKPLPQQRKRLSIDPNSNTPFRDLLRRCDEMPGVIAMRQDSDSCDSDGPSTLYVTALETPCKGEDEWK